MSKKPDKSGEAKSNKPSGDFLNDLFAQIELIRLRKKRCGEDEAALLAGAKSKGYDPKTIRALLSLRAKKPSDRDDESALLDIYMDVTGMARQPSLFRAAGLMSVDPAAREQVLAAFKAFVPAAGDVIIRFDGSPVRLFRNAAGAVQVEDWVEPKVAKGEDRGAPPAPDLPVPDVDEKGAARLGKEAFGNDQPITANPFPAADKRRRAWDKGWREASGGDGMGPGGGT